MGTLKFIGGASKVTGSAYLLSTGKSTILIDCGAEQEEGFSIEDYKDKIDNIPDADYCIITHAHYDHFGLLPLLVKRGKLKKRIISTPATKALAEIILRDSVRIQASENEIPAHTDEDVNLTILLWDTRDDKIDFSLDGSSKAALYNSSHIIGSSSVFIRTENGNYLFTGDIGSRCQEMMDYPPDKPEEGVDYLIIESTYGGKTHERDEKGSLVHIIEKTCNAGGKVLIPVFAIGRLQEVLYALNNLKSKWKIYVDTPMGNRVTRLQEEYALYLKKNLRKKILGGEKILGDYETINTNNQSIELSLTKDPCVILSASGMLEGGRIENHFKTIRDDKNSTLLFVCYQAKGTRGRRVLDGEEAVLCNIERLSSFSSHADANELYGYITSLKYLPYKTYLVHGEAEQRNSLMKKLESLKIIVYAPDNYDASGRSIILSENKITITCPVSFSDFYGYSVSPLIGAIVKTGDDDLQIVDKGCIYRVMEEKGREISGLLDMPASIDKEENIEIEMSREEFENNIRMLYRLKIYTNNLITSFFEALKEKGTKAALQFAREKHEMNINTSRRRWNEPESEKEIDR